MPFAHAHTCNHPHLDPQTPSKSLPKAIAETGQALHDSYVRTFVARDHMRRLNRPTPWPPRSLTPRPSIPAVQWLGRRVPHPPALTYGAAALALTRERHADADSEPHSESCRPCRPKFATPQVIQSRHSTAMSAAARPKCVVNQGLVTPLGVLPVHVYVSLVAWSASKLYVCNAAGGSARLKLSIYGIWPLSRIYNLPPLPAALYVGFPAKGELRSHEEKRAMQLT